MTAVTAIILTRDQVLARRDALLAGCRLSRDELYERAELWTLSQEERNVYETLRSLDWLLGEDGGRSVSGGLLDCCEGEEIHGDPHGLHSFDCPDYQRNAAVLEQIFGHGDRPAPHAPSPTLETLIANTELRLVVKFIREQFEGSADVAAYKTWLVDKLAGGEHRKGRRRE